MKKLLKDIDWKQALFSILIGSVVAFLTTVLQGILDLLHQIPSEGVGGLTATAWYLRRFL